jgi:hypothetical protein
MTPTMYRRDGMADWTPIWNPRDAMPENGGVLRDRAQGFGAEQIDALMKDAWVAGYWAGKNEGSTEGRAEGEEGGYARGRHDAARKVQDVLNRQLNHSARRLEDRAQRGKTTINDEREFIAREVELLRRAIRDLEEITGDRPLPF